MKKLLSILLAAAMLLSLAVISAGAANTSVYDAFAGRVDACLTAEQKDSQGIYYTLDDATMTAIVGTNTYSDSASAGLDASANDSIVIPATVTLGENTYTVAAIGRNAFDGTAVREVVILGSCVIGEFAFAGCGELETVYAPDTTEIKGFAFWGCGKLNLVNIIGADSIGGGAFWGCGNLSSIALSADTIMTKAFADSGLTDVVFENATAPAVGADAFPAGAVGYIPEGATGYDAIGIITMPTTGPVLAVESVYADAGETVQVALYYLDGMDAEDGTAFSIDLTLNNALTIDSVISGAENGTLGEDVAFVDGTVSGTISTDIPSIPVVILNVKVADTAAGKLEINAIPGASATTLTGYVTVCDHANTEKITIKAATCDEAGEAQTICADCRTVISTDTIEAKGHDYSDFVIAPTCTEGGYTRHICTCCSDAYSDSELEALGHSWDEGEVKVQASTSKEGLVIYTCTTCGASKEVTVPKIKYADADENGKINVADVTLILKYIAKWDVTLNLVNADVNCDDKINVADATTILKFIAGWEVEFGPKK